MLPDRQAVWRMSASRIAVLPFLPAREDTALSRLGRDLAVTVSVGVAVSEPGEHADPLMDRADQRLYAAKTSGKNCVFPTAD